MARLAEQFFGNDKVFGILQNLLVQKKFFNSSIFSGPEGIGKKKCALAIVQEINCIHTPACGQCQTCVRVATSPHEVLRLIECSTEKIKIEQIQEILEFVTHTSWIAHRFVILDGAEKLTTAAANILLKTLEEMPLGVHFIFITPQISQIIPTVRSRCQVVTFESLKERDLQKIFPESLPWQRQWSSGRASLLQKIMDPEWLNLRQLAINYLHGSQKLDIHKSMVEAFASATKVDFIIHCWQSYVRDAVVTRMHAGLPLYNVDIQQFVEKFSQHPSLFKLYDNMSEARRDSQGAVDKNLILENLSFQLG